MSVCQVNSENTDMCLPEFVDIKLPSGNVVTVKNGTDWLTLNKIGEELILFSLALEKMSK